MRTPHLTPLVRAVAAAAAALVIGGARPSAIRAAEPPAATKPAAPPVVLPAVVEPLEQSDLHAKTSGYVSDVKVDIGDRVQAGQILAVIDAPELESELAEARATLAAKKMMQEAAAAALKQTEAARDVARRQVERYQAESRLQETTLRRQQELHAGKAITEQQLDDARSRAEIAKSDTGIAEAKVAAAEADVKGAQATRAVTEAQAQVAAAQVAKVETLQRYLKIVAPFDGVVSRRMVNRGDLAQAAAAGRSAAMFTVQRIDVVRVRADVPEGVAHRIPRGTPASVKLVAAGGDPITAAVTRSAGSLNPESRTMRIEIELPNPQGRLVPGTYAQVTFTPEPATPRVAEGTGPR